MKFSIYLHRRVFVMFVYFYLQLQALKAVFNEEQEKNNKLVKKVEKYRKKYHVWPFKICIDVY